MRSQSAMYPVSHAVVFSRHQPAGNLEHLLVTRGWEAREILFAMDRIPRSLWGHEDVSRVHLALSGLLLETLSSPLFQRRVYSIVDCGSLLWHLQNARIIHILGTGYYHPLLPLVPSAAREEQVRRWLGIGRHLFARPSFTGFWPPEMGFSMELIPLLARAGYRYVLVDSTHVEPVTPMRWEELRYRPHIAQYGGAQIVVVRDRELSDAQEAGMDYAWFEREVSARTRWCAFAPLVTTCSDGENGGWFRNVNESANFWGPFYVELLATARSERLAIHPTFIDDYLSLHGADGYVTVRAGAWNTGWHDGEGFTQWTGSQARRDALDRARALSESIRKARCRVEEWGREASEQQHELEEAEWHLLRAETRCNFYWGEAWVGRAHADLDQADGHRQRALHLLRGLDRAGLGAVETSSTSPARALRRIGRSFVGANTVGRSGSGGLPKISNAKALNLFLGIHGRDAVGALPWGLARLQASFRASSPRAATGCCSASTLAMRTAGECPFRLERRWKLFSFGRGSFWRRSIGGTSSAQAVARTAPAPAAVDAGHWVSLAPAGFAHQVAAIADPRSMGPLLASRGMGW